MPKFQSVGVIWITGLCLIKSRSKPELLDFDLLIVDKAPTFNRLFDFRENLKLINGLKTPMNNDNLNMIFAFFQGNNKSFYSTREIYDSCRKR